MMLSMVISAYKLSTWKAEEGEYGELEGVNKCQYPQGGIAQTSTDTKAGTGTGTRPKTQG